MLAHFSNDRDEVCLPTRIGFNATASSSIVNYEWNFGDASPLESTTSNSISHHYDSFGEYTATLKSYNSFGCYATYSKQIRVVQPQISGSLSDPTGCVPATNSFNVNVGIPSGSTVTQYTWDFGDGTSINTTSASTTHAYANPGNYQPVLTIQTNDGCSNSFAFDSVKYGTPPTNVIAYPVIPVFCGSEAGQFIAHATNADSYDWNFGGSGVITVRDTFIEHKFSSLGIKTVSVTPKYNNCPGPTITMQVEVIGVIAGFTYRNTCEDKKTFSFTNTSDGNLSSILWRFGDQTPTVTQRDPVHTFPTSGVFRTKLLVEDNITGCVDSAFARIFTANPVLVNPDHSICINTESRFRLTNNYQNNAATYEWNVIGNQLATAGETDIRVLADSLGHFNDNLVSINNGNAYCPDTIHLDHPITVRGPKLDFESPVSLCLNTPLRVRNLSQPYLATDSIVSWQWNFGRADANFNGFEPAPYQYPVHKNYNIKLTAIDKFSCKDSLVKPIAVRPMPFLWIIPRIDTLCLGQQDSVIAYTSDEVLWTPSVAGPAFCNTCDSTFVRPTETTRYRVTSTNSFGCSVSDSTLFKVYKPFDAVPLTPFTSVCEGESVRLQIEPRDKKIIWTPSAGLSNARIHNPVARPDRTTIFTAQLSDSVGCFNSETDVKVVINPTPVVNAGPDQQYAYHTNFTITPAYSANVVRFEWSPADSLSCSHCPNPSSIATRLKTYHITVTSDSGCVSTDQLTIAVQCKDAYILMPSAFTPDNNGVNDRYYPITRGIQQIKRFSLFNRMGQLLYTFENFVPNKTKLGWDGRFRSIEQPAGTYVYTLEAVCETGQAISKKGSFILIR